MHMGHAHAADLRLCHQRHAAEPAKGGVHLVAQGLKQPSVQAVGWRGEQMADTCGDSGPLQQIRLVQRARASQGLAFACLSRSMA